MNGEANMETFLFATLGERERSRNLSQERRSADVYQIGDQKSVKLSWTEQRLWPSARVRKLRDSSMSQASHPDYLN